MMNTEHATTVDAQLAPFGARLATDGRIVRGDKTLDVTITYARKRYRAATSSGTALWSGADVAAFVQRFWGWKAVAS